MSKALNYITAFFGFLLVAGGLLKSLGMLKSFTLSISNTYLTVPNSTSFTYILIINFIGRGAMIYHALSTLNFRNKAVPEIDSDILDATEKKPEPKGMSRISLLTGLITIMICFIFFVRTMILLAALKTAQ